MAGPILVGYDGSEASNVATQFAAERCRALRRKLVLCNVVPASLKHVAFSELLLPGIELNKLVNVEKFQDAARKRLEEVAAGLRRQGLEVEAVVRAGDTADELLAAARELHAEQLVLGYMSYEHKLPYGVGTVAEKVMRYADRTVTVVRPPGAPAKDAKPATRGGSRAARGPAKP